MMIIFCLERIRILGLQCPVVHQVLQLLGSYLTEYLYIEQREREK
jgi:hypothetical protein